MTATVLTCGLDGFVVGLASVVGVSCFLSSSDFVSSAILASESVNFRTKDGAINSFCASVNSLYVTLASTTAFLSANVNALTPGKSSNFVVNNADFVPSL